MDTEPSSPLYLPLDLYFSFSFFFPRVTFGTAKWGLLAPESRVSHKYNCNAFPFSFISLVFGSHDSVRRQHPPRQKGITGITNLILFLSWMNRVYVLVCVLSKSALCSENSLGGKKENQFEICPVEKGAAGFKCTFFILSCVLANGEND